MFVRSIIAAMRLPAIVLACLLTCTGCYKHVVRTSDDPSMPRQTYDPNVDDTEPGFFDQLFWGDPPAGQDPVEYYRLKRAGKDIPPTTVPRPLPTPPPASAPSGSGNAPAGTAP
ncbi:MAG: hypothetical protein RL461_388 [Planctomycetota bacterium]|jgi:hypothetical protein